MIISRSSLPVALAFSVFLMSGCATGYHGSGFTGGYSETQLAEDVFRVSFRGNGFTSSERAADFTLLRSAELVQEHGYSYFVIVDESESVSRSTYTTPTNTTGSATVTGNTVSGTATTTGGQTYTVTKPRARNTIIGMRTKPDGFSYEAEFVIASLREKYGLGSDNSERQQ